MTSSSSSDTNTAPSITITSATNTTARLSTTKNARQAVPNTLSQQQQQQPSSSSQRNYYVGIDDDDDEEFMDDDDDDPNYEEEGRFSDNHKKMNQSTGSKDNLNNNNTNSKTQNFPEDQYNLAYILFLILGVGTILSGICFSVAIDFFREIYPENSSYLEYIVTFGYNAGQIIGILAVVLFCPATMSETEKLMKNRSGVLTSLFLSVRERIYLFQIVNFVCMCVVCCVNLIVMLEFGEHYVKDASYGKSVALWVTVTMNVITGIGSGVLVASLFAFAAIFPWDYTQSAMGGLALAGAIASVLHIATKYYFTEKTFRSIIGENVTFFGLAAAWHLLCIVAFFILVRLPITEYCAHKYRLLCSSKFIASVSGDDNVQSDTGSIHIQQQQQGLLATDGGEDLSMKSYGAIVDQESHQQIVGNVSVNYQTGTDTYTDIDSAMTTVFEHQKKQTEVRSRFFSILYKLLSVGWGVFVTFFITFSLAPGVITDIKPRGELMKSENWFSIVVLTCFNVSDCIGRFLPRWKRTILLNHKQLWIVILGRLIFFIVIILCVVPKIYGDIWVCLIVIAFGVSHGYCASLGMMIGPTLAAPEEAELSAIVMTLYLNLGLFVGSALQLVLGVVFKL